MVTAEEAAAPTWQIPQTPLVTIEYPGVVQDTSNSLNRALATLSPHMGPNGGVQSASSALAHLARVIALGGKLVECRLAPLSADNQEMQVYRHPLLGDVVPGRELVVRLHRRHWQRRSADGHTETRKAYTVSLLGTVQATIRFVRMADFGFKPDLPARATEHPTTTLHRALVEMDVGALQRYRFPPETEEYEVQSEHDPKRMRSNLAMIPPPFFSRMELPFSYLYRQNPTSSLQTVSYASTSKRSRKTARKGQADVEATESDQRIVTRYVNRSRWRNMAPIALKFAEGSPAPNEPEEALRKIPLSDRHKSLLSQLEAFHDSEARALVQYVTRSSRSKELFALVAYTFADGPWRDTLVRFGYDPRTDQESRLYVVCLPSYQRIHLRGKAPRHPTTRGAFKAEYGDVLQGSREPTNALSSETRPATHIFDGKNAQLASSTFQLCDITDVTLAPLIHVDGPGQVRDTPDVRRVLTKIATGWYTAPAWDAIRSAISRQFHTLLSEASTAERRPAEASWEAPDDGEEDDHENDDNDQTSDDT